MAQEKLIGSGKIFLINTLSNQSILAILSLLAILAIILIILRLKRFRNNMPSHIVRISIVFLSLYLTSKLLSQFIKLHDLSIITSKEINFLFLVAIVALALRECFLFADHFRKHLENTGKNVTSAQLITRVIKIACSISILLMFGEQFGLSFAGLLTFGGIGGIAIGLAGRDILSNLFSGIMIYFDRPFNIGDWIRSPDRKIEGTVMEIGWRTTKIMTFQNRPLYVPNYIFSTICVENPGRMRNWRINASIGILCEDADKIKIIVDQIRDMLKKNENIDKNQTLLVNFNQIGDCSLNILVYCFTKTTVWSEWMQILENVYLEIIRIIQKNGSDLAYPTRKVFLEQMTKQ